MGRAVRAQFLAFGHIACVSLVSWPDPEYGIEFESKLRCVYLIARLQFYQGICRARLNPGPAPKNIQNYSGVWGFCEDWGIIENATNYRWSGNCLPYAGRTAYSYLRYRYLVAWEDSNFRIPRRFVVGWCGFCRLIAQRTLFIDQIGFRRTRKCARNEPQQDPDPERWRATTISYSHPDPEPWTRQRRVYESRGRFGLKDGIFLGNGNPWSPLDSHLIQLPLKNPSRSDSSGGCEQSKNRGSSENRNRYLFALAAMSILGMENAAVGVYGICYGRESSMYFVLNILLWIIGLVALIGGLGSILGVIAVYS